MNGVTQIQEQGKDQPEDTAGNDPRIGPLAQVVAAVDHKKDTDQHPGGQERKRGVDRSAVHLLQSFQGKHAQAFAGGDLGAQPAGLHQVHDTGDEADADADRSQQQ